MKICSEQIKSKGSEPINQMWIQKVEDKVLKDFSNQMSALIYNDGFQPKQDLAISRLVTKSNQPNKWKQDLANSDKMQLKQGHQKKDS